MTWWFTHVCWWVFFLILFRPAWHAFIGRPEGHRKPVEPQRGTGRHGIPPREIGDERAAYVRAKLERIEAAQRAR